MKQYLLSNNATQMIEVIRENIDREKAFLCDVFADVVFQASASTNRNAAWRTLIAIQEYSHLMDCLTKTDNELKDTDEKNKQL